jgi:hypothetical protein
MKMMTGVKVTSRCGRKSGPRQEVGTIEIEQFESIGEAVQFLGSEEKALDLINSQFATNAKNRARGLANVAVSDRKIQDMAVKRLTSNLDLLQELIAAGGTESARDAILNRIEGEIRAELDAAKPGEATEATEAEGEEGGEE